MRIHHIQRARHRAQHHSRNLERKKEIRPEPSIPRDIIAHDTKPVQPRTPQHELRNDQHHPKLRLEHAAVPARQPASAGVGDQAGEAEADEGAEEGAGVHVSRLDLVEEERRAEHDGGEDDADEDGPADEGALDEAGPEDARVQEEREGAEQELEVVFRGFAAVEGEEALGSCCSGGPMRFHVGDIGICVRVGGVFPVKTVATIRARSSWGRGLNVVLIEFLEDGGGIDVEVVWTSICGFGHKEDYDGKKSAGEDGNKIESPVPSHCECDFSNNDRGEEGTAEKS